MGLGGGRGGGIDGYCPFFLTRPEKVNRIGKKVKRLGEEAMPQNKLMRRRGKRV